MHIRTDSHTHTNARARMCVTVKFCRCKTSCVFQLMCATNFDINHLSFREKRNSSKSCNVNIVATSLYRHIRKNSNEEIHRQSYRCQYKSKQIFILPNSIMNMINYAKDYSNNLHEQSICTININTTCT